MPQALRIKRDISIGIPQSSPPGWKWRCVGAERPSAGKLVSNPSLESALPTKMNFTLKECAAFGIAHLHFDDNITSKINDVAHYFQPAASKFKQWACESETSKEYKQMTLRTFQTAPQWLSDNAFHWKLYIEHRFKPRVQVVSSGQQNWGHVLQSHANHENNVMVVNKSFESHARS